MPEWRKVITGIILAGILGSLFGFDFDEWLKLESLATIPAPAHPSVLLLFLGLFLGFWLIPKCVQV
ncbi:MAG: hypothetical protein R3229_18385, partial [Alphaproteobacteria bacterium]|nr:hypothetical protein [Alphaproteobacteria bacterium]